MSLCRTLAICALGIGVAACNPTTQKAMQDGVRSGAALENLAASGSAIAKTRQVVVSRSKQQVIASLEAFSEQCLAMSVRYGRFVGDAAIQNDYVPVIRDEGGVTRHVLFRKAGGHSTVQWSKAGQGYNAAASTRIEATGPQSTRLAITTTFGLSRYADAVTRAVNGEGMFCPKLP